MLTLNVARTKHEQDNVTGEYIYHLEIIGEDGKGTGRWIVLRTKSSLTLMACQRLTIEIEDAE